MFAVSSRVATAFQQFNANSNTRNLENHFVSFGTFVVSRYVVSRDALLRHVMLPLFHHTLLAVMLCYVVLCCIMLHYVTLCCVPLRFVTLCYVTRRSAMVTYAVSFFV